MFAIFGHVFYVPVGWQAVTTSRVQPRCDVHRIVCPALMLQYRVGRVHFPDPVSGPETSRVQTLFGRSVCGSRQGLVAPHGGSTPFRGLLYRVDIVEDLVRIRSIQTNTAGFGYVSGVAAKATQGADVECVGPGTHDVLALVAVQPDQAQHCDHDDHDGGEHDD